VRYAKIECKIWNDEKFISLTEQSKFFFLYLLSCPHSNLIGAFVLKIGYAADDLKWTPAKVTQALRELVKSGSVSYDPKVSLLVLHNFLRYNLPANPNQAKSCLLILAELPKSKILQGVIKDCIEIAERFRISCATIEQPLLNTDTETDTESEADTDTDTLQGLAPRVKKVRPVLGTGQADKFELFWQAYPRKKSKGDAEKAWAGLHPDDLLFARVMKSVALAKSVSWIDKEDQYIPYPATWLRAKGWEDETTEGGVATRWQDLVRAPLTLS
jgi:hypothetical protein